MYCEIVKIVKLYKKYPEYKGKVFVDTPYGKKRIIEARFIDKEIPLTIKTKDFELTGSKEHRIYSNNEWKYLKNLKIFDDVETKVGTQKIESIIKGTEKIDLYDIQVEDVKQYYSNGILSHNSSLMETIPYALYGNLHKNVKKEQIINWKNRKGCEVRLSFSKGDNKYRIVRGIKPDTLEIYENDYLLPKPAHIKDYQTQLNEIIGLNHQTFMSLVYSNINSSVPILSMKTPEKRKFLEHIFGLSLYTKMNEHTNSKISVLNSKIRDIEVKTESNKQNIETFSNRVRSIEGKISLMKNSEIELKEEEERLNELLDTNKGMDEKKALIEEDISTVNSKINNISFIINRIHNKEDIINSKLKSVRLDKKEIENLISKNEKATKYQEKLNDLIQASGDYEEITEEINKLKSELDNINNDIKDLTQFENETNVEITGLKTTYDILVDRYNKLKSNKECPLCGQDIEDNNLSEEIGEEIETIKSKLDKKEEEKVNLILNRKQRNNYLKSIKDYINNLETTKDDIQRLMEKTKKSSIADYIDKLDKLDKSKTRYECVKDKFNKIFKKFNDELLIHEKKEENLKNELNNIKIIEKTIENLKNTINSLKDRVLLELNTKKEYQELIESDKLEINKNKNSNDDMVKEKKKYLKMLDYMDHIKTICKDTNIKQFAISNFMPFLNKRVNHYLSEINFGFYTEVSNWLEVTLKGPGITKGTYDSLSGGESRGIDLAIQLALLDVAKIQAGIFPDLAIFDELLDSSVDSQGLENLLKIIDKKQKDEGGKIFLISHRSELENMEFDKIYKITKRKGFSFVE